MQWYSMFWGLAVFGFNSMIQPAGSVCGAPVYVSFMLRVSPLICMIDAFVLFQRLATYYRDPESDKTKRFYERLLAAHQRLLFLRFQNHTDAVDDLQTELVGLQRNRAARFFAFIMTLGQMIKFYSYGGIIWTKVIASMYLASFLIIEALVVWPSTRPLRPTGPLSRREQAIRGSGATSLPYASVALSVALVLWALAVACKDIFGHPHHTLPRWLGLVIATLGSLFCVSSFAFGVLKSKTWQDNTRAALLLIPALGVPWAYYGLESLLAKHTLHDVVLQTITGALAVVWVIFTLMFMSKCTETVRAIGQDRARQQMEQTTAWYFLFLQILAGPIYYMYSYDPTGTSKLSWADFLG